MCPTHPVSLVLYSLLMKQAAWCCTLSRQSTSCFKYGSHTVWLYSSKDLIRAMYAKHRHFWGQFRRFCWRKQVSILLCYRCLRCGWTISNQLRCAHQGMGSVGLASGLLHQGCRERRTWLLQEGCNTTVH